MTLAPARFDTRKHNAKIRARLKELGRTSDRFEYEYQVSHDFHGGNWLHLTVYDRAVHVGKKVTGHQRDFQQIAYSGPVVALEGYPETHTLGICPECSERWAGEQS